MVQLLLALDALVEQAHPSAPDAASIRAEIPQGCKYALLDHGHLRDLADGARVLLGHTDRTEGTGSQAEGGKGYDMVALSLKAIPLNGVFQPSDVLRITGLEECLGDRPAAVSQEEGRAIESNYVTGGLMLCLANPVELLEKELRHSEVREAYGREKLFLRRSQAMRKRRGGVLVGTLIKEKLQPKLASRGKSWG